MNTVKLKNPIKIIPSENYLLVIEDADGVNHYWHKKHTSTIEGKEVHFKDGDYDGFSRDCKDVETKKYAIVKLNITNSSDNPETAILFGKGKYFEHLNFGNSEHITIVSMSKDLTYTEIIDNLEDCCTNLINIKSTDKSTYTEILSYIAEEVETSSVVTMPINLKSYLDDGINTPEKVEKDGVSIPIKLPIPDGARFELPIPPKSSMEVTFHLEEK